MLRLFKRYFHFSNVIKPTQNTAKSTQTSQIKSEGQKPKLKKISRKKIDMQQLKPIKRQYQSNQDIYTKAENAYHENIKHKIQQNMGTRKFYQYEIKRGEDLIDHIPVDPYYEYKLADLQAEVQYRKKMIKNLQGIEEFVDPQRYEKLKNLVETFENKKHRYERDYFFKKLKQYPGSARGPNPEDDPERFAQYVNTIMTPNLRAEIIAQMKDRKIEITKSDEQQVYEIPPPLTNVLSTDLSETLKRKKSSAQPKPEEQGENPIDEQAREILLQYMQASSPSEGNDAVPIYPYSAFEEYHTYMKKLKTWSQFRKTYDEFHREKKLKQTINFIEQVLLSQRQKKSLEHSAQNHGKAAKKKYSKRQKALKQAQQRRNGKLKFEPTTYSLFTYYKTLPKEIQQHPGVKITYLGLQYCSPDIEYQKKQQILNLAAKTSLPLDKFSTAIMQKVMSCTKKYLTPHLTDRVINMNPQFTWDIHEFLNEVKDEKLRTISTVKEQEKSYPQPPELTQLSDQHLPNLPVDFYDNEDGFWDSYIDQKLKRYQKVRPLCTGPKKHFVH